MVDLKEVRRAEQLVMLLVASLGKLLAALLAVLKVVMLDMKVADSMAFWMVELKAAMLAAEKADKME